jgi:hypothetical protein
VVLALVVLAGGSIAFMLFGLPPASVTVPSIILVVFIMKRD